MWKKEELPDPAPAPRREAASGIERSAPVRAGAERATIGRSITIRGEVSGDEDLLIQGRVDGSVNLQQHSVTVGSEGEVKADITARVVTVEGSVEGNLKAEEQVILRSSALVKGDISAPRVALEDGARFRGGVDMGESLERTSAGAARQTSGADNDRTTRRGVEASTGNSASTDADSGASTGLKGVSPAAAQASR